MKKRKKGLFYKTPCSLV